MRTVSFREGIGWNINQMIWPKNRTSPLSWTLEMERTFFVSSRAIFILFVLLQQTRPTWRVFNLVANQWTRINHKWKMNKHIVCYPRFFFVGFYHPINIYQLSLSRDNPFKSISTLDTTIIHVCVCVCVFEWLLHRCQCAPITTIPDIPNNMMHKSLSLELGRLSH